MSSNERRQPLVNQVISDKVVAAENIGTLNMGDLVLMPTPNQLPPDIKFFSGRASEIDELKQALSKEKSVIAVCSLWGMGGVGKSALAVHVANEMYREGHFQDGMLFANLGEISVDDALGIFIQAFNYNQNQIPEPLQGKVNLYRSILRNKQVLIFLDNVKNEDQVFPFLLDEPTVAIIATSRKHLLALTEYSAFIKDLDVFSPEEAEELLKKRVGSRSDTETLAVVEICKLAGYLPLAISLVASSLADKNKWPVLQKFVERLEDVDRRLDALSGPNSIDRGLRRVFQVSYDALSEDRKKTIALLTLFERSVFGSSGLVALTNINKDDAIDQLDGFVNLSLILRADFGGYKFHDLLLLFVKEKIDEFPESDINIAKSKLEHYRFLLNESRQLGDQAYLLARAGDLDQARELYLESLNTFKQLQSRSGQANIMSELATTYSKQNQFDDAVEYYQQSLKLYKEIGSLFGQARILRLLASLYVEKKELDNAIDYYKMSVSIYREIGSIQGQTSALGGLAFALVQKGEITQAIDYYEQDIDLYKKTNNLTGQARIFGGLASTYALQGNWDKAIENYQREYKIYLEIGNRQDQANALGKMAAIFGERGDFDHAIEYYQKEFEIFKEIGNRGGQSISLSGQASVFAQKGDLNKAIEFHNHALTVDLEGGNLWGQANALGGLASAFAQKGDFDQAIIYYQQAQVHNKKIGNIKGQAKALGGLASAFIQKRDLDKSIDYFQQALTLDKKIGNLFGQARALSGLATAYAQKKDWEKVIDYQEQAAKISEISNDIKGQEIAFGSIAMAYSKLSHYDKTIEFQLKALKLNKTINNPRGEGIIYCALAVAYQNKGDEENALLYYLEAQKINERERDIRGTIRALGGIANIYYRKKDWGKAIIYLEKVLVLNRKSRDRFLSKTLYQLAVSCKLVGDLEKSKEYIEEAYQLTKGQVDGVARLYNEFFRGR